MKLLTFQLCCDACKVGQEIAKSGGRCDRPILDLITDRVKNECCSEHDIEKDYSLETGETSSEELRYDDDESKWEPCGEDHECQHKCYIRGNEAFCDCEKGYMLGSDGRSCKKEIDELKWSVCDHGFKKDELGDCVDINECQNDVCDKIENCTNTVGSFVCNIVDFCPKGFTFNQNAIKCEGRIKFLFSPN